MYKIAAIGNKDSVLGFASLGLDVFSPLGTKEASRLIGHLAKEGYAVIFLTEALAKELQDELEKYNSLPLPAITLIPGASGNTGEGMKAIGRFVEQAVGSDIL